MLLGISLVVAMLIGMILAGVMFTEGIRTGRMEGEYHLQRQAVAKGFGKFIYNKGGLDFVWTESVNDWIKEDELIYPIEDRYDLERI